MAGWVPILPDHRPLRRQSQACRGVPGEGSWPRRSYRNRAVELGPPWRAPGQRRSRAWTLKSSQLGASPGGREGRRGEQGQQGNEPEAGCKRPDDTDTEREAGREALTEVWADHLHGEALSFLQVMQTPEHAVLHEGSGRRGPEEGGTHPGSQWVGPGGKIFTSVRRLDSPGGLRKAVSLSHWPHR